MSVGLFGWPLFDVRQLPEPPRPGHGKRRGVTQSPRRPKRRNRRKP